MSLDVFYPAAGGDDCNWYPDTPYFSSSGFTLELGSNVSSGNPSNFSVRFPNVTIPKDATISSAIIRFVSGGNKSATTVNVNNYFNNVDDASAPTSLEEGEALALTEAIAWNNISGWVTDSTYDSPNLASILQPIINRAGWGSGNALQVIIKDNGSTSEAQRYAKSYNYSPATRPELHITWETGIREISETVNITSEFGTNVDELEEDVNVLSEFADNFGAVPGVVNVLSGFDHNWAETNEDISVNSKFAAITGGFVVGDISVGVAFTSAYGKPFSESISITSSFTSEHSIGVQESVLVTSDIEGYRYFNKIIIDTLSSWDTLKWGWNKTVVDSFDVIETASKILGIPVSEWLSITDRETANWGGVEGISDSFYAVDILKAVKVYYDAVADGVDVTDATKLALELVLTDILTNSDTIFDIGVFQYLIKDGITFEDIAKRFFLKIVSDSFAAVDTNLSAFLALLQISDSFNAVDTATRLVEINQVIADSLAMLDIVAIQQFIQELIQEKLIVDLSVIIDGEVWETWVLNTSNFHPSVYSGYDYNSFATFNNTVYGCKSDGIYKLEGVNDNGVTFHSGIILPVTKFGAVNNKRFRKAYFGAVGNDLVMKMKTDNGYKTFKVVDSEMSLTHDLKGRKWEIMLEDFDELDFIELIPVILSRK